MANNFDSNFTRKLARVFLSKFETMRTISKCVNTQLLAGKFNPDSGANVDFKRPTDFTAKSTSDGDISAETKDDIITGKATGTVQNYITVHVDYSEADQAIKMGQLEQLLAPMATRIVTELELRFASFVIKNAGLMAGTFGTAVTTWDDVARAGAVMCSHGIPMDKEWAYLINPYTQAVLSNTQRSLGAGGVAGAAVDSALKRATLTSMFAGFNVIASTTLPSFTTGTGADRAGALNGNPTVTYVAHKDTMVQDLVVDGFQADLAIAAGEVVQITGRNRLNLSTRQPILTDAGANVVYTGVVNSAVTLDGSGAGTISITGPAIYEATGAYNTVDSAPVNNDVVTLLGSADTLYQPNMFMHPDAFSIGSVPLEKLYSTDTIAQTEDGMQVRVSKFAQGLENKQIVRFDFRPAFAALNPFFAGQGWG